MKTNNYELIVYDITILQFNRKGANENIKE